VARLAEHGAHVYMCARNPAKASAAIASIKELYPKSNITLLEMDQMNLSSVVAAAKLFLSKEVALHGLVNNAGIMATPFEVSKDGYEAQWQTNYLAHWVFTSDLLPLMLKTSKTLPAGSVRIVNISSAGHFVAPSGGINFADTNLPNKPNNRYRANLPISCTPKLSTNSTAPRPPVPRLRRARFGHLLCIPGSLRVSLRGEWRVRRKELCSRCSTCLGVIWTLILGLGHRCSVLRVL
jgi:NAD(P)-dependent dehydrogenase (short-subunit alcohol dehydrogenase family)